MGFVLRFRNVGATLAVALLIGAPSLLEQQTYEARHCERSFRGTRMRNAAIPPKQRAALKSMRHFSTFASMKKGGNTYIMTNPHNNVFYVGCTSDLIVRVHQHKTKVFPKSFTAKYNCVKLVYYESFHTIEEAIAREKQIKAGSRQKKIDLIISMNPEWEDLFDSL